MSWKTVKLGEVLSHRKGSITIDDEKEYKLCRVQLHRRGVLLREIQKASLIKTKKQQVCKGGDFLVAEMDAKFGGYGFVPEELEGAIVSSHYFLFEVNEKRLRRGYLEVVSFLEIIQEQIKAKGSTNYSAVRPKDVLEWEIPLPTIEKQIEIEELFSITKGKVGAILSELTHQQTLLTRLRQSILQEAVQGKLTAQWRQENPNVEPASELLRRIREEKEILLEKGIIKAGKKQAPEAHKEIMFEIPKTWVWIDLEDISQYIADGTHQTPNYKSKGRIFLSAQNIKPFRFMPEDHKFISEEAYQEIIKNKLAEKGDILVARVGAGIGEAAVIDREIEFGFYVSLGLVKTFKALTNSDYLTLVFNSPFGVGYSKGNISSKGGSAGNFNLGRIRSFPIPLPPLPEQQAIVATVERLLGVVGQLETESSAQRALAEGLLQAALREAMSGNGEG